MRYALFPDAGITAAIVIAAVDSKDALQSVGDLAQSGLHQGGTVVDTVGHYWLRHPARNAG